MSDAGIIGEMLSNDSFSQWLGIDVIEVTENLVQIKMETRPEMCNGFNLVHGGILHAFADSAMAFASNAMGRKAVSIESSISHLKAVHSGEILTATATPIKIGKKVSVYHVAVFSNNQLVADFKGTVYIKVSPA